MAIEVITEFIAKATVRAMAYVYDDDSELADPTSIKVTIFDKDGIQKAGDIGVSASASFTVGLTVTGGTSEATGVVMSIPDGTSLHLQQVTGTWESGEAITDTGSGTSTTTSVLVGTDMTQYEIEEVGQTGIYEYFYKTIASNTKSRYWGKVEVIDGTAPDDITSMGAFSFRIK